MKRSTLLYLILPIMCITLVLAGCTTKDSDEDYGEAYDVDYMTTEYVDQLIRDGAETLVGTVEIAGEEDDYDVTVVEKKVVVNDNYEDGYYIADKNVSGVYPLGSDMGILCNEDGQLKAITADEFIQNHSGDAESLYTVYLIGDVVELIQPLDPKSLVNADH